MGGFSIWHWLVVGIVVMLLFGKGRFSDMMGDVAKGLKSFKKGMADEEDVRPVPPSRDPSRDLAHDPARVTDARPVATPVDPIDVTPSRDPMVDPGAIDRR